MDIESEKGPAENRFGKYSILNFLGKGGMAEVYKAKLHGIGGFEKILVIKKILPQLASSENFIKMFFDEAKVTVALQHPNIVQVFELGEIDNTFYMSMEYVDGCNVNTLVGRCMKKMTRIPFKHIIYMIMEVCKGLYYAHKATDAQGVPLNIIHRDVTHSNILLSFGGDVKLADFGIAKAKIVQGRDQPGILKGKMSYMAPEMLMGQDIDHRVDIFSLGVVFFELLTMKKLFRGKTDEGVVQKIMNHDIEQTLMEHSTIPDDVQDILKRALARNVSDRYQSVQEVFTDLNDFIFNHSIQVSPHEFADFVCGIVQERKSIIGTEAEQDRERTSPSISEVFRVDTSSRERLVIDLSVMEKFKPDPALLGEGNGEKRVSRAPAEAKAEYSGEISRFLVPRLISRLVANRLSGKLKIVIGDVYKAVFLERGNISSVSSDLPEERLERYLIETTSLDLIEIEEAAKTIRDDSLALHFYRAQKLQKEELEACMAAAYRGRLAAVMGAKGGRYEFFKNAAAPVKVLDIPLPGFTLLSDAVREALAYEDYIQLLGKYLDRRLMHVENKNISLEDIALNQEELEVLGTIPLDQDLRTILETGGDMDRKNIIARVLYLLYQYELIKFQ